MKYDIERLINLPRKSSKDYLELMHQALELGDKQWFEELAKEKVRIEKIEEKIKKELGWRGEN
ncbi:MULTISPECIES: hypothetical protein [Bacillales]|uniref:hypothetical protein n=1 Tax=Bacillales TaxID=1385 RepID=UPI001E604736|nr:hypothetical protein [Metabacillus sp. B2-18]UGB30955.1 hypothetical protein LPC09_25270 [Metabacillus sp. B2-18]